jgi:hypothetical protein
MRTTRFADRYDNRSLKIALEMIDDISYVTNKSASVRKVSIVALHLGVFRVSYFPQETDV